MDDLRHHSSSTDTAGDLDWTSFPSVGWCLIQWLWQFMSYLCPPTRSPTIYFLLNMISSKKDKAWLFLWCHFFPQWKCCQIALQVEDLLSPKSQDWYGADGRWFECFSKTSPAFFLEDGFHIDLIHIFRGHAMRVKLGEPAGCPMVLQQQTFKQFSLPPPNPSPKPALRERHLHPQQNWQFLD